MDSLYLEAKEGKRMERKKMGKKTKIGRGGGQRGAEKIWRLRRLQKRRK